MNISFIIYALGRLMILVAGIMCIPAVIGFLEMSSVDISVSYLSESIAGFIVAIVSASLSGATMIFIGSKKVKGDNIREGFVIVTFGWVLAAFFGMIPLANYLLVTG
ncbi:MAG: hypothetical protein GX811_11000, partial [Lentisphaerae bacterium]|nr:hypothetical protein [Lentisphaerota bacterium]